MNALTPVGLAFNVQPIQPLCVLLQRIQLSEKCAIPSDLIVQKGLQLHPLVGFLCQSRLELVDVAIRAHAAVLTVSFVLSVHAFVTA